MTASLAWHSSITLIDKDVKLSMWTYIEKLFVLQELLIIHWPPLRNWSLEVLPV